MKKLKTIPFGVPLVWREQENHHNNCYFCKVSSKNLTKINKSKIKYPNLKSAITPVSHCDEILVPNPLTEMQSSSESKSKKIASDREHYQNEMSNKSPKLFLQVQLNDLMRDLNFSKEAARILRSKLKE